MSTKPAPTEPAAAPDAVAQPVATTVAQHMLVAGQAADNDLHDAIMRIPAKSSPYPNYTAGEVIAHMQGHRDARHAAAELVSAHAAAASAQPDAQYAQGFRDGWNECRDRKKGMPDGVPKRPLPPRDQSLPNSGLEPDWNGYALAEKEAAAQGDAKHLVDAVTAVMSKHGLIDHLTLDATERFCDELLATFKARQELEQGQMRKLLDIVGAAYQVAGAHDASEGVLDVLCDPMAATAEQVDALLPYSLPPAAQPVSHRPTDQWRGMNPDLRDAINKLTMNDAVARASLHVGIGQGLSETDTLAHIVLNLAASKEQLETNLHKFMALLPPGPGKAAL